MKRLIGVFTIVLLLGLIPFALVGCGGGYTTPPPNGGDENGYDNGYENGGEPIDPVTVQSIEFEWVAVLQYIQDTDEIKKVLGESIEFVIGAEVDSIDKGKITETIEGIVLRGLPIRIEVVEIFAQEDVLVIRVREERVTNLEDKDYVLAFELEGTEHLYGLNIAIVLGSLFDELVTLLEVEGIMFALDARTFGLSFPFFFVGDENKADVQIVKDIVSALPLPLPPELDGLVSIVVVPWFL